MLEHVSDMFFVFFLSFCVFVVLACSTDVPAESTTLDAHVQGEYL